MPLMPMFGRSMLYVHSHCVAWSRVSSMVLIMYWSSHSCRTVRSQRSLHAFCCGWQGWMCGTAQGRRCSWDRKAIWQRTTSAAATPSRPPWPLATCHRWKPPAPGNSGMHEKAAEGYPWRPIMHADAGSTLTGLVALLRLVDHIYAAFAAHDLAIAMTRLQRPERVCNLHG